MEYEQRLEICFPTWACFLNFSMEDQAPGGLPTPKELQACGAGLQAAWSQAQRNQPVISQTTADL